VHTASLLSWWSVGYRVASIQHVTRLHSQPISVPELFSIVASAGLTAHSYADDTQLYISAPVASASVTVQCFISCAVFHLNQRIDEWMSSYRLKMNADKRKRIIINICKQS